MTEQERVLSFQEVIHQAAKRVCRKLDAWEFEDDLRQEGWLVVIEDSTLTDPMGDGIHRLLGSRMASFVVRQKHLGMTGNLEPEKSIDSPLTREMISWALPHLHQDYRWVIKTAMEGGYINPYDLKNAFKELSDVVNLRAS